MRLIADFVSEKEAYGLYCFLAKQNVESTYEPYTDHASGEKRYAVWVYSENDLEAAQEWASRYKANPSDPAFAAPPPQTVPLVRETPLPKKPVVSWQLNVDIRPRAHRGMFGLTHLLLFACILLFLWNDLQKDKVLEEKGLLAWQVGMTPIQKELMFDYPKAFAMLEDVVSCYPLQSLQDTESLPPEGRALFEKAEATPSWKGLYDLILHWKREGSTQMESIPMFEKIDQGEVWRLFTPVLIHSDFLHILFNMAWLWILGKQVEERAGKLRMLAMILVIGIVSNTAQYLMSGPYFLGFSGVVVGMAGFIWVRQKIAPWEGYPLQKGTLLFLLIFVAVMFAIELIAFMLQFFQLATISPNIANTAHIVGGLTGMAIARLPIFTRGNR